MPSTTFDTHSAVCPALLRNMYTKNRLFQISFSVENMETKIQIISLKIIFQSPYRWIESKVFFFTRKIETHNVQIFENCVV